MTDKETSTNNNKNGNSAEPASLQDQINQLKAQLSKQRKVLTQTAEQLLSLQLQQSRQQLSAIPNPDPKSVLAAQSSRGSTTTTTTTADTTDFATNEDLVQLVGELQGQLTILEKRSINRVTNSQLTEDLDAVLPMPNADGAPATDALHYPATLKDFKELSADALLDLCSFYELLPETAEEEAIMRAFMTGKIESPNVPLGQFKPKAEDYSKETISQLYEELRKFIGLAYKHN
ncbi:hypothetical protein FOA43_003691 [Brettanomyces nanus]|uniref:Uncharacterized protein n=1 Tax=Eeniella nana TaxID=13502 RepID=A0A875S7Q6_EENNA|nr:uncharacterized protein FOA43_003691 [Brettanomyces nanus]QPG76305.1 hypothetical protein FOA43_003691 [Brettanomyces nanus]